ncbi:hypothetical protein HanRHA438_Chr01g0045911 [Helianthus annuus]|nr:hypothetical protein HanRHA438_Chr01g0045911 [Helianthus annuus]
MDNSPPYYKEGLPLSTTLSKSEKQRSRSSSRSSVPSIFFAFFSCVAWLYIAGRLWQDAENRMLLANLLMQNSAERPKVLNR